MWNASVRAESMDPSNPEFFSCSQHVFVLTWAARPVFSLVGDSQLLASFFAVISALTENVASKDDTLLSISSRSCRIIFQKEGNVLVA